MLKEQGCGAMVGCCEGTPNNSVSAVSSRLRTKSETFLLNREESSGSACRDSKERRRDLLLVIDTKLFLGYGVRVAYMVYKSPLPSYSLLKNSSTLHVL